MTGPGLVVAPAFGPRSIRRALALLAVVAVPRLIAFPLNENLYGDAVVRTWLAEQWAKAPHVIGSFDQGAAQFGPLHIYLLALASWLWPSPEHAGRLVSLIVGTLTALPLDALVRRLAGPVAAVWAVVGLAFWGVHIQCSTTAASEALNLLLVISTIALLAAWFDTGRRSHLLGAALLLNLACATRYDSWLLVPLLAALVWWRGRRFGPALVFGLASCAFAWPWMMGNQIDRGSAFFPFTFIDDFHRGWYPGEAATWGPIYPLMTLGFWPGAAVVMLTPLVAVAGGLGLVRAWRTMPQWRWLVVVIVVPTVMYTVRATLLKSFVPIARFTLKEVALLLPFVWLGAQPVLAAIPAWAARGLKVAGVACVVGWPIGLGAYCYRTSGTWQNTLRPVSPTSTNSDFVLSAARWLRENVTPNEVLIVDLDPRGYDDVQVSFFSHVEFEKGARFRAKTFEERLRNGPWGALVRFDEVPGRGGLEASHQLVRDGSTVTFRGVSFDEVPTSPGPLHVYRRREPVQR